MEVIRGKMKNQKGGVSIIVVLFATFLFVALTVGFTVLMVRDQNRATDNDLSQSALDSAKAGVEDAKRVIESYNKCRLSSTGISVKTGSGGGAVNCGDVVDSVESGSCQTVSRFISGGDTKEVKIRQNSADEKLDQAYTCVKIIPYTENVVKKIKDESDVKVVPLQSRGDISKYNSPADGVAQPVQPNNSPKASYIEVTWVSGDEPRKFLTAGGIASAISSPNSEAEAQLPRKSNWKSEWGSILRVQTVTYDPAKADVYGSLDQNTKVSFLYPVKGGSPNSIGESEKIKMNDIDTHQPLPEVADKYAGENGGTDLPANYKSDMTTAGKAKNGGPLKANQPVLVGCSDTAKYESGGRKYHCRAIIDLEADSTKTITYVTLSGMYVPSDGLNTSIRMLDSGFKPVMYDSVQPLVDSTGRANDVFRRVQSRVDTPNTNENALPLPRAAFSVHGDLCKDYMIADSKEDFAEGKCNKIKSRYDVTGDQNNQFKQP